MISKKLFDKIQEVFVMNGKFCKKREEKGLVNLIIYKKIKNPTIVAELYF